MRSAEKNAATQPGSLHRRRSQWLAAFVLGTTAAFAGYLCWLRFWPHPVLPVTLGMNVFERFLEGGNPFPPRIQRLTPEEEASAKACEHVEPTLRLSYGEGTKFDRSTARVQLEAILGKDPASFHAGSLLATWHRRYGDPARVEDYLNFAAKTAPVILVQPFAGADGTPLTGAKIQEVRVACTLALDGGRERSVSLTFYDLVTDTQGCIRMPVSTRSVPSTACRPPRTIRWTCLHWPGSAPSGKSAACRQRSCTFTSDERHSGQRRIG